MTDKINVRQALREAAGNATRLVENIEELFDADAAGDTDVRLHSDHHSMLLDIQDQAAILKAKMFEMVRARDKKKTLLYPKAESWQS